MKHSMIIMVILTVLCLISTGVAISSHQKLESTRQLAGDMIMEGRTSQIFNEDGEYINPQAADKYLSTSTLRFLGAYLKSIDFKDTSSTTIHIGDDSTTYNSGCIAIGDSSATGTIVYITATGGTVSATTTKPSICQ